MPEPSREEVAQEAEELLAELSDIVAFLEREEDEMQAEIAAVTKQYAPRIDVLTAQRTRLVDALSQLYVDHRELLVDGPGKTVFLRSGTLSARSSSRLVVSNESLAIRFLRKMRKLRKFTRLGKRTIDKPALKSDPAFAAKVPGVELVNEEKLTIKLPNNQGELVRDLHPLRRQLSSN